VTLPSRLLVALAFAASINAAQAGVIEDLLASPAIQSLLGRQPELQTILQRCTEARYRQRNTAVCKQADEASRLAKIPPDLRAVLASPAASASIRELCLGAQATPTSSTYLCTELGKADVGFAALAEEYRRNVQSGNQMKANQAAELGK